MYNSIIYICILYIYTMILDWFEDAIPNMGWVKLIITI